jgi:hypothetical protein
MLPRLPIRLSPRPRHISRTNAFNPPPTLADRCPPPLHITAVQERRRRRRRGDVPLRQDTEDRGQDGTIKPLPPTHSATFDDETRVSLSATDWLGADDIPPTQPRSKQRPMTDENDDEVRARSAQHRMRVHRCFPFRHAPTRVHSRPVPDDTPDTPRKHKHRSRGTISGPRRR